MHIDTKTMRLLLAACALLTSLGGSAQKRLLVKAGDAGSLLDAIEQANRLNADTASARLFILVPDGVYDLGDRVLTTISGHNVSVVGQSMLGTVIRNAPDAANEGIGKTATLRIMATGTYLQDLTLQNALDYYGSGFAGRAVALHDRQSNHTICKRVRLLSYQDTYYSDSEQAQLYFEDSEIHGTVDFICGAGDVFFNRCTLVTERRTADGSGRCVIAAPRTSKTPWGYVFSECTIKNDVSSFQYARGWHTTPHCIFLNTTLTQPDKLASPRFDPRGMRTVQSDFREYHTVDLAGRDITPASNVVTFTLPTDSNAVETILTPQEARRYTLKNIFPRWRPDKVTRRLERQSLKMRKAAGL